MGREDGANKASLQVHGIAFWLHIITLEFLLLILLVFSHREMRLNRRGGTE